LLEEQALPPLPEAIFRDINSFDPTNWALSIGSGAEELKSLGKIFQSAVALYCTLSLQNVSLVEFSAEIEDYTSQHYEKLLSLLQLSVVSPYIRQVLIWPLAVLGVAAAQKGDPATRTFVGEQLLQYRQLLGQAIPKRLKELLERFWVSGKTHWDDCFVEPFCVSA
jgi:hypothetical protein